MTASDTATTVVLIVASPAERQRLARLTRTTRLQVRYCPAADDLASAVSGCAAVAVVADACDESGTPMAPALERLRRLIPTVSIILLLHPHCSSTVALAALRIADDVIFDGEMSDALLWSAINRATRRRRSSGSKRRRKAPTLETNESPERSPGRLESP